MIDKISIKNFKSIVDLEMELGRVNILIGANGCGKTNILEAIAKASAANQNKLDDEYLGARLRMTEPDFMQAEFDRYQDNKSKNIIYISIFDNSKKVPIYCGLFFDVNTKKWEDAGGLLQDFRIAEVLKNIKDDKSFNSVIKQFEGADIEILQSTDSFIDIQEKIPKVFKHIKSELFYNPHLASFLIFSPEETKLRTFNDDTAIKPLGRKGEGMFRHLKELLTNGDKEQIIEALNEGLSLLDWFKGFDIPKDLFTMEARLDICDRFLNEAKQIFDQRSANEGFLYLLFYLTLFNSEKTPSFFAIDNIETSLNPKLARELLQHLVKVAKEKGKQVIITTHNPYVLDGLNLMDDEQRLFVVRRNIDGHTKVSRVPYKENRNLPLSEVWMSGVLGGLPDNF